MQAFDGLAISPIAAQQMIAKGALLLDVRSREEYQARHVENAVNVPVTDLEKGIAKMVRDKNRQIVVYCNTGSRSRQAVEKLIDLGYARTYDVGNIMDYTYNGAWNAQEQQTAV